MPVSKILQHGARRGSLCYRRLMMRQLFLLIAFCFSAPAADDWGPVQFLLGRWTAEGGPAGSAGAFSFLPDLQGKILVRKSFAEYPASAGRPALRHDDLTVIYREEGSSRLKALYWDNEGHVITYTVTSTQGGVVFRSEGAPEQTRYRLSYVTLAENRVQIRFDIAPPGKDFAPYLESRARRQTP